MIYSCAEYDMTISKDKNDVARTRSHVKKPYKFYLDVEGQGRDHKCTQYVVIHPRAKYDMQ